MEATIIETQTVEVPTAEWLVNQHRRKELVTSDLNKWMNVFAILMLRSEYNTLYYYWRDEVRGR